MVFEGFFENIPATNTCRLREGVLLALRTGITIVEDQSGKAGITITGSTGLGIYINKTANTDATMKVHCHQAAAGVEVANEFKGEFLSTSGTMDGIASHYHMSASGTGVLRAILGVAYLDTGITLSGTSATGSWINGILGSVNVAGVLNGTAVTVTGVYGGLGSMTGGTLTACKYMSAIWADSQVTQVPSSGEAQLLLMTNGLGATLGQCIYIDGNNRITYFLNVVDDGGTGFSSTSANPTQRTATCDAALKVKIGGHALYIPAYYAVTLT